MTDFMHKNTALRLECIKSIEDSLKKIEGHQYSLIDPTLDPEEDDIYWDLPMAIHFGKYGYGIEYNITSVRLENDDIWFNGRDRDQGDEFSFGSGEVDLWVLSEIADTLNELKEK
jgi:hypothetical protein